MAAFAAIAENLAPYVESFRAREKELAGRGGPWLHRIRKAAFQRFCELGFPSTHVEEWKYTNVAPIARTVFAPAPDGPAARVGEALAEAPLAAVDATRVVLVNGRYSAELSSPGGLPEGVTLCRLAEALETRGELIEQHLARYAGFEKQAFTALNTAFFEDGVLLSIPNGTVLDRPVYIVAVSIAGGRPAVSYPRTLIVTGRDSQAQIIEGYFGLEDEVYFTDAVAEIVVGEGSVVEYTKVLAEADRAYHIGALQAVLERSSNFTSNSITLGGDLVRNEICAVLNGEGAECTLNGLYVATGRQHIDNHTTIDHAQPRCPSRELYKGILDGKAQGVFHGRIIVRPGAQKTDAIQRNKNLLLSEDAVINTKPQLEIYADDVRCTHGATIGQVDADAVFYLRSRGIGRKEARNLLTYAFASEMLDRLKSEALRSRLAEELFRRLNTEQPAPVRLL